MLYKSISREYKRFYGVLMKKMVGNGRFLEEKDSHKIIPTVTLEHDTSLHHCDYLGWVIFLKVHSYLWLIIPSLRFWVNATNSS